MVKQSKRPRRGIVLLIVLSMLVIFSLLVTTFVVVSGNYRTAAIMAARGRAKANDPRELLDNVMSSLLVDTNDPQSPMRTHGLLRDMYGNDGFVARVKDIEDVTNVNSVSQSTNGQFFQLELMMPGVNSPTFQRTVPRDNSGRPYALSRIVGYYNGLVLTFVDGNAKGVSTRIIGYNASGLGGSGIPVFRLMVIDPTAVSAAPQTGDTVVVNGRPFSGTGFGYNPVAPNTNAFSMQSLNAPDPGYDGKWGIADFDDDGNGFIDDLFEAGDGDDLILSALIPNRSTHVNSDVALSNYLRGGADERYDAADFQNVHLAAIIPAYNQYEMGSFPDSYDFRRLNRNLVLPSFHRPMLINWWLRNEIAPRLENLIGGPPTEEQLLNVFLQPYGFDNIRANSDDPIQDIEFLDFVVNLKQKIIARPLPELNPNFSGGNAAFRPEYLSAVPNDQSLDYRNPYLMGPWDVDNDGDGEPDGIWMDVGLPIEEDSQGRLFKGLVSILCVDLDGRLNLNAQGSQGHLNALEPNTDPNRIVRVVHPFSFARNGSRLTLHPGRGTGPADVTLRPFFNLLTEPDPTNPINANTLDLIRWDNYRRLLNGAILPDVGRPILGRYGLDQVPGLPGLDFFSSIKHYEYPENYFNVGVTGRLSAFQTPPDLYGEIMLALDHRGQPAYSRQPGDATNTVTFRYLNRDHPYEKNLLKPSGADSLYTIAELEGLLRFYDPDMNPGGGPLPQRLTLMFENGPPLNNNLFTNSDFAPLARQSVTTHSFDLPVPNMLEPPDLAAFFPDANPRALSPQDLRYLILKPHASIPSERVVGTLSAPGFSQNDNHRMHHVTDLLRARLIQGFGWANVNSGESVSVMSTWNQTSSPHDERLNQLITGMAPYLSMLSPDLAMGLRMDVNRPFGNGRDDNDNLIVDEHGFFFPAINPTTPGNTSPFRFTLEGGMGVDGWDNDRDGTVDEAAQGDFEAEALWGGGTGFDQDNDGFVGQDNNEFLARQHYARHLYLLAMMLKDPIHRGTEDSNGDGIVNRLDVAHSIAQWAVNVVDFRDADSIMTPFEYDSRPFTPEPGLDGVWGNPGDDDGINGSDDLGEAMWPGSDDVPPWGVDGLLGPGDPGPDLSWGTPDDLTDTGFRDRDVVWGCERPELLITETLAFHDRRTEDLDDSGNGTVSDPEGDAMMDPTALENDFDQKLRPRGALYVELYNPWTSNAERHPAEFYHTGTAAGGWAPGVVLHKVNSNGTDAGSPIWRMTVTTADDDTMKFPIPDPDHPGAELTTERVIYFTDTTTSTVMAPVDSVRPGSATRAIKHDTTVPTTVGLASILPGRYAVVGTYRAAGDLEDPETMSTDGRINGFDNEFYARVGRHSAGGAIEDTRRFVMRAHPDANENWFYVEENPDASGLPSRYQPNVSAGTAPNDDVADILPPVAVPIRGLNISEGRIDWDGTTATKDTYPAGAYDESAGGYPVPYDLPFDVDPDLAMDPDPANSDSSDRSSDALTENGTYSAIRFVHLQRLANPLLPYDRLYNPYRTVDTMPVDLTVFNGVEDDSTDNSVDSGSYAFDSRERGSGSKTPTAPHRSLMDDLTNGPKPTVAGAVFDHHFTYGLTHSLGYLNRTFGARYRWNFGSTGLPTNAPDSDRSYVGGPNTNDPTFDPEGGQPFPWLTWLNRPFTSQYDLMLVPAVTSSQLFKTFSLAEPDEIGDADPILSIYSPGARPNFSHLKNFFSSTRPDAGLGGGLNLAGVFDFTHVPSKFLGTETWLDPSVFNRPVAGTDFLHPPFNKISAYREPGKINLNTIYNHFVMDGLRGGHVPTGVGPAYWQLVDSRRGFGERPVDAAQTRPPVPPERLTTTPANGEWIPAGTTVPELRPILFNGNTRGFYDPVVTDVPTIFNNPFRGFGDNALVTPGAAGFLRWTRHPIESTLLRSNRFDPQISLDPNAVFPIRPKTSKAAGEADPDLPLFNRPIGPPFGPSALAVGAAYPAVGQTHVDPVRNPYFRNEPIHRMANMTTTRSNVYTVWITLGFFEVEQDPPLRFAPNQGTEAAHLNRFGYRLGNEVGWDTGDIRRHRAFYVIDRSIPVAFEPGKMHNAEKTIMLRKFIE